MWTWIELLAFKTLLCVDKRDKTPSHIGFNLNTILDPALYIYR